MQKSLVPFKTFYFFFYAAMAFIAPFLTVYYAGLGMTGNQIGTLAALPSIITFISAPVFGAVADITRRHKRILGISILLVIADLLILSLVRDFWGLALTVLVYAFFFAPILPLIDRTVIEILDSDRDQYGKQRLWGAVGWGLMAPLSGYAVGLGGIQWAFYGAAILYFFLFIVSQMTPIRPVKIQVDYWKGFRGLFSEWRVIVFFAVALIGGMGLASIHNYLYLFLDHLGASPVTMGTALTVATASELVVMYFADRLLKSWKAKGLILFGLSMLTIRLVGYSVIQTPALALTLQLLHGPTFAAIWLAGVEYVAEIAPPGLGTTAQGLFTGVVMGLGSAFGAFLGGILYQGLGFSRMYLSAGFVVFISLILFWFICRKDC